MRAYATAPLSDVQAVIQRDCACGGTCATCAADDRFGIQTKLRLGPPGDRFEQEADRVADQITRPGTAPRAAPVAVSSVIQRMPEDTGERDEEDEAIQSRRATAPAAGSPGALQSAAAAISGNGQPLSRATRAYFEPRFGRDLSHVRVHTDAAAGAAAHRIGARAYALRGDIAFAPGAYSPDTGTGRHLIAHELTHVLQQGAAPDALVQRAPENEAEPEAAAPEDEAATETAAPADETGPETIAPEDLAIFASPSVSPTSTQEILVQDDWTARTAQVFYAGDAMDVTVASFAQTIEDEVAFTFPAGQVALSERHDNHRIRARIIAPSPQAPQQITFALSSRFFAQDIRFTFTVHPTPQEADTTDDREEQLDADIDAKKAERRQLRSDFRKQSRADRRAGRAEFKAQKAALRADIKALKKDRKAQRETTDCSLDQQREVEKAVNHAAATAARALSGFSPSAPPSARVSSALSRFFGIDTSTADPAEVEATLRLVADVLNLARNGALGSHPDQYQCGDLGCDESTGALVRVLKRGNTVSLCHKWLRGNLSFPMADTTDDARAYAILHEFVHLAGIESTQEIKGDEDGELYSGQGGWNELTRSQYKEMADAYSAFAWALGENKGEDGS